MSSRWRLRGQEAHACILLIVSKSALVALPAVALQVIPACTCDRVRTDGAHAVINETELARTQGGDCIFTQETMS